MASIETSKLPLTPKQRLALSRRALVGQLNGTQESHAPSLDDAAGQPWDDELEYAHTDVPQADEQGGRRTPLWSSVARNVAQRWWRRHPAHAAGQLARPVLEHYARTQPVKLMAVAAVTGSVVVLVKPWRLLSLTAVLAAVLKTSDVADVINTLMQKTNSPPRKDSP